MKSQNQTESLMEILQKDPHYKNIDLEFLFSPASEGFLKTIEEAAADAGT